MIFALNAKAFFYIGHDVTGKWNPFSLSPLPDEPSQSEIAYIYLAPFIGPLPSSLFSAHIFFALLNSFFIVILYLLVKKLLQNSILAFLVGLVACFNPWEIFFGRSAFETSSAMIFYILGFYVLISVSNWKKILAFVPLALGFYTYMAYKVTLIPYTAIISFFTFIQIDKKKNIFPYITLLLLGIAVSLLFLFKAYVGHDINRLGEVTFFSSTNISDEVNYERRIAIQNPLELVFSNKLFVAGKYLAGKYIGAFSINNLFVDSERLLRFHIYNHGHFYYVDLLFFLLGFCFLFAYKRKLWLLFVSIMLIAPLPSVLSSQGVTYVMRSSLYMPFFYIFIGTGIWYAITWFKNKKYIVISSIVIGLIYAILVGNFLYTYFFIQPIYASEAQTFSSRLLSKYATLALEQNKQINIVLGSPRVQFKDFVYYANLYNSTNVKTITKAFYTHNYIYKNASFVTCNSIKSLDKNTIYIFDPGEKCLLFKNVKDTITIPQLSDSGSVFDIYQDSICSNYQLHTYISKITLQDLSVEKLNISDFCQTFLIKYSPH